MKKIISLVICMCLFFGCDGTDVHDEWAEGPGAEYRQAAKNDLPNKVSPERPEAHVSLEEGTTRADGPSLTSRRGDTGCTCTDRQSGLLILDGRQGYTFTLTTRMKATKSYVLALKQHEEQRAVVGLYELVQPTRPCGVIAATDMRLVRTISLVPNERVIVDEIGSVLIWSSQAQGSTPSAITLIYEPAPLPSQDPRQPTEPKPHGPMFVCPAAIGSLTS